MGVEMTGEIFPVEDWLLNLPLYSPVNLGDKIVEGIQTLLLFEGTMDAYCPECQQSSTFMALVSEGAERQRREELRTLAINRLAMVAGSPRDGRKVWLYPEFSKSIACTRAGHIVHFNFVFRDGAITKIGQYPSLADMAAGDISQFEKALGRTRLYELNKAIGLAAHGVGIGSYVYLRRVFESLIEEAHTKALGDAAWNEGAYQKGRMKEKVSMLKDHLPEFIIEHPELYSILSLGVHELTEDECMSNFEALKSGILVIAEERMHEIQRAKRYKEASQAVLSVSSKMHK
jgi:hypothetical protein